MGMCSLKLPQRTVQHSDQKMFLLNWRPTNGALLLNRKVPQADQEPQGQVALTGSARVAEGPLSL